MVTIKSEDIGPPSARFLRFVRGLKGFPFLNHFTMPEFTALVRRQFTNREGD